jgi:flagellar hook assembly protein FlgD
MTGAETPVQFKLQIMTVSGKVVREVTAAEFGPLTAGTHQSNFCWDGKDEYGDQLANGVYLYRITARKADGTAFEFFENSSVDGYFKGGFGKMVLMR